MGYSSRSCPIYKYATPAPKPTPATSLDASHLQDSTGNIPPPPPSRPRSPPSTLPPHSPSARPPVALKVPSLLCLCGRSNILANNLPAEIHKGLVDTGSPPSTSLVVRGVTPAGGDGEGASAGDGPVFFEVGLVADDDEGDAGVIFDADDLFAQFVEFVEGGEGGDGEDEEEALAGFHVELSVLWSGTR